MDLTGATKTLGRLWTEDDEFGHLHIASDAPDASWRQPNAAATATHARCYDPQWSYTELFFSERPVQIAEAKAICNGCEIRERCLTGALARREPYGVWGGEFFVNGRVVPTRRGRGRPRKNPVAVA